MPVVFGTVSAAGSVVVVPLTAGGITSGEVLPRRRQRDDHRDHRDDDDPATAQVIKARLPLSTLGDKVTDGRPPAGKAGRHP
jgi:hypothetical protein